MARPRKKKEDLGYTFQRSRSGWCLTQYHSDCPAIFPSGECTCECHLAAPNVKDKK